LICRKEANALWMQTAQEASNK